MATFSVKTGGSSSYGAALKLDITQGTQSIANNTTVVNYRLYLSRDGGNSQMWANGAYRRTVTVDGTSVVNTTGNYSLQGSSEYTLASGSRTVTHNTNGTKTVTVSGSFTGIGIHGGTTNISGSLTLTTIARASTLTAFSFASNIKPSTAVTINYTVDRKSSSLRHDVTLLDGSTTLGTWTGQNSNGASTVSLPWQNVNTLLSRMSNVETKSLTLRVQTKSGSSNIGSAVSRTASVRVDSTVKPTVSTATPKISGSGRDSSIGKYVQSVTRVSSSMTASAVGGTSISSQSITVRRKTSNTDAQKISGSSGTTANPVSLSGVYEIYGSATDARGRTTNGTSTEFTVHAYSPPVITSFSAERLSDPETTVAIKSAGSFTGLSGTENTVTVVLERKSGSSSTWSAIGNSKTSSNGSFTRNENVLNNSDLISHDFRLTVTDSFGNKATSLTSVSTKKILFQFNKDIGIGIGKPHERGVLDVGGESYFNGLVHFTEGIQSQRVPNGADLNNITRTGFYHSPLNNDVRTMENRPHDDAFALLVEQTAGVKQTWTRYNRNIKDTWMRQYYSGVWGAWQKIY